MEPDQIERGIESDVCHARPRTNLGQNPKGATMANPVPAGSDVSAGTYRCTKCGTEIQVGSTGHLPPCPSCGNGQYDMVTGGDGVNDPYPDR